MLASSPLAIGQDSSSEVPQETSPGTRTDVRESITYDHVYGNRRISVGGFSPTRITWLDDESYIQRDSDGWGKYSAKSGDRRPWYDATQLAGALLRVPNLSDADARRMAGGAWIAFLPKERLAVFRAGSRLIRASLDGADLAVVDNVPTDMELTTLSPTGSGLAFVHSNELWVADFTAQQVRQLTRDATPFVRNAKADWVYFEEVYSRDWQAYRWSPDGANLAYQQFDQYDYAGRLVQVQSVDFSGGLAVISTSTYAYDALGRRVAKTVTSGGLPPVTTQFLYDGADVIEERENGVVGWGFVRPRRHAFAR